MKEEIDELKKEHTASPPTRKIDKLWIKLRESESIGLIIKESKETMGEHVVNSYYMFSGLSEKNVVDWLLIVHAISPRDIKMLEFDEKLTSKIQKNIWSSDGILLICSNEKMAHNIPNPNDKFSSKTSNVKSIPSLRLLVTFSSKLPALIAEVFKSYDEDTKNIINITDLVGQDFLLEKCFMKMVSKLCETNNYRYVVINLHKISDSNVMTTFENDFDDFIEGEWLIYKHATDNDKLNSEQMPLSKLTVKVIGGKVKKRKMLDGKTEPGDIVTLSRELRTFCKKTLVNFNKCINLLRTIQESNDKVMKETLIKTPIQTPTQSPTLTADFTPTRCAKLSKNELPLLPLLPNISNTMSPYHTPVKTPFKVPCKTPRFETPNIDLLMDSDAEDVLLAESLL